MFAEVREAAEQVIAELDHLFSLLLHVACVAVVGNLDNGGCRWWLQESLLELNLLQEKLVGLVGLELVLELDFEELFGGDWRVGVEQELLDELGGCLSCRW